MVTAFSPVIFFVHMRSMKYFTRDTYLSGRNACSSIVCSCFIFFSPFPGIFHYGFMPVASCGQTLWTLPIFRTSSSVNPSPFANSCFCSSINLVPEMICSKYRSSVSMVSRNLHVFAFNQHLAIKSSIISVPLCV